MLFAERVQPFCLLEGHRNLHYAYLELRNKNHDWSEAALSYQEIGEKIKVLAVFKNGTVFPYVFEWHSKRRRIDKVNLSYQERDGASINYWFAIESAGLVAKIRYNNISMIWTMEEIWTD